jgi:2-polyprenyl-3-methyl-5-hydroxy-6-metoxy-1,4-benzoquinol methylase
MTVPASKSHDHPCDVCGSDDAEEVEILRQYTGGEPIHTCCQCGFVYVRRRRSAAAIAAVWSDELFGSHYTARKPYAVARQVFLAEILDSELGLQDAQLCDIGAGEGEFLTLARHRYGATVFGVEPSATNCGLMRDAGIPCFNGTAEQMAASGERTGQFDIVTMMWTLENCESPQALMMTARELLKPEGHVLLATGSRILVPFKKPLHLYISPGPPADTHAFRFSANTQRGLLAGCGYEVTFTNRYVDHDVLCMIGKRRSRSAAIPWEGDNYRAVIDFFERWHSETETYYR